MTTIEPHIIEQISGSRDAGYGSGTLHDKAVSNVAGLIELLRDGELDESCSYAFEARTVRSYMLGGGGPTTWIHFVTNSDGEVDHAYLEYVSASGTGIALVPDYISERLLDALDGRG